MDHSHSTTCLGPLAIAEQTPPSTNRDSGQMLKFGVLRPRDTIERLPERIVDWLHEGLDARDRRRLALHNGVTAEFESLVSERLFPPDDHRSFVQELRQHCRTTAVAASVVAEHVGLLPETLYVCGLLHDVGFASALHHLDQVLDLVDWRSIESQLPSLLRASAQHTSHLSMRWRLPSRIRFVLRDHVNYATLTTPSREASATILAEYIAQLHGHGGEVEHRPNVPARGVDDALRHLQLQRHELSSMHNKVSARLALGPNVLRMSLVARALL